VLALGRVLRWLTTGCAIVGSAALLLMMLQIAADVALKNLFGWPLPLTATLVTKWYMVAVAFLPLALTEILDRHIAVEVVFHKFPRSWQRIGGGLVCLMSALIVAYLALPLWEEAVKRMNAGTFIVENNVILAIWQPYFFLPVGFGLFAAVLLYRAAVLLGRMKSGMGEVPIDAEDDAAGRAD